MKFLNKICFLTLLPVLFSIVLLAQGKVEKWGIFELTLSGPADGNPYAITSLNAEFKNGDEVYQPDGFYDGNGIYKVRFMPDKEGKWTYITHSNQDTLDHIKGSFICIPPSKDNHGPVSVKNTYHFTYADSTRFIPFGTTIYEWCFQSDVLKKETIETLKQSPFNKVRFLLIPPHREKYDKGINFPFAKDRDGGWDISRFNPDYFKNIENCIKELEKIGVQADVILFNPYDKGWGFEKMNQLENLSYVKYVISRLSAYRNVWWSLANENSFIKWMNDKDWDGIFQFIQKKDPYHHLRSIHNAGRIYNYSHPWVSHVSLQYYNVSKVFGVVPLLRDIYRKPIVMDEINYEGDINRRWGQLSGKEMARRFWITYIGGGFATHGEAFESNGWISTGGKLIGKSPDRIAFLKKIFDTAPPIDPVEQYYVLNMAGKEGAYYLIYFGKEKPTEWKFELPDNELKEGYTFKADILDTWNMTITPVNKTFEVERLDDYKFVDKKGQSIQLPGRPYMALRITRVN